MMLSIDYYPRDWCYSFWDWLLSTKSKRFRLCGYTFGIVQPEPYREPDKIDAAMVGGPLDGKRMMVMDSPRIVFPVLNQDQLAPRYFNGPLMLSNPHFDEAVYERVSITYHYRGPSEEVVAE